MPQSSIQINLPVIEGEKESFDISVIIVSYNTKQITLECIASIFAHKADFKVQIIVIDNCSKDGSSEAIREAYPDILVIDSPQNGGFAYGNNIGFNHARGKFVLLLNPDTRIYADCFQHCLEHMQKHPKTAIMGPLVRLEDGNQQSSMIRFLSLTQLFFIIFIPSLWMRKTRLFGDLRYAALSRDESHKVDAVSGCFMFARRQLLEEIGGLDTRFFMYGEEAEWCFRAGRAGWDIVYNPDVEILHHGAASTAHMSEWKAIEMTRGHILFLRFTRGRFVAWIGTLLMTIRDIVRLPYYGVKTVANGFRWSDAAKPWRARLKFEMHALFNLPAGQVIDTPDYNI